MSRSRLSHNLLIAFRTISTRRRLEADCSDGLQVQLQRKLTAPYFRLEALRFLDVKTPVHDQFAKVGVKKCLDDVEMSLKQKEFIPAGNFKIFCGMFYRLSSLNKLCQNQVVETCGLERIVNLLKMIVERQEQYKDSKPLKLLCHGLLNLEFVLTNKPAKDRLAILVKPVVPPLLSRILASERNITAEPVMARALTHLSKVIDGNFTDEEKSKIARLVWREFDMIYANYGPQKAFFSLFHVMTLFVELGVNEQQEKGYFPWVDSFVVRWIDIMRCDAMKLCRMKMLMHLYFVFIGLNNGKYDIIYGQKERWSNALRETKSFLDNKEIENLKKYVEQVPLSDKTGQRLVDELNLLFK